MLLYNNNPEYGDCGPFECQSPEELADGMEPTFVEWAQEAWGAYCDGQVDPDDRECQILSEAEWVEIHVPQMRREFLRGLAEIITCPECGEDYHADAPERGHDADCPLR